MGAAAYIGRVGGLAVALGVGTAIATGYGVASADDTASTPPSSDTSATSGSADTNTNANANTNTTNTTTGTSTQTSTEKSTETSGREDAATGTTVASGVVSAQTNTGSTGTSTETTETPEEADTPARTENPDGETPEPTEYADPEPTETKDREPSEKPVGVHTSTVNNNSRASSLPAAPKATASARTVDALPDPASTIQAPSTVAVFADAGALAAAGPTNVSPMMAAQSGQINAKAAAPVAADAPDPVASAVNVVSSIVNWILNPLAGSAPIAPAQPPLIWGLLAFARREFENFFGALSGRSTANPAAAQPTTSLALAAAETMSNLAAAATAIVTYPPPGVPYPGQQFSPSTQFVRWVTGQYQYADDPLLANTYTRYTVWGTDVGTMWDNGIPDNPATPINEHQVLIAVGDTFGSANMGQPWRANTIFRSSDIDLSDGMDIPDGQWFNGNMFGGAPLGPNSTTARQVIFPEGLPAGVTLIPTAGISVPTPGSRFGAIQYVSFMSVTQWGAPGSWTTNYSAIAWSDDNGETFHVAPSTVRYNQPWSGNQNFQQSAFVRPGDGYVYMYGTPNGRRGAAYLARVPETDILDLTKYDYYNAGSAGWFGWGATPAGWHRNNPGAATPVFGQDTGACGVANPGNQVSEMSVQYNSYLKKYVVLYGDQFNNIVMRTSDTPQGTWSTAKVLMAQQSGGVYAPMMHPWSPSTMGTGSDLYWNLSLWSEYNVMLLRTDLTKV
jgi:hypothetical protein